LSKRKIITVALLGLFICSMLILVPIQPVTQSQKETGTSTFVISSWDYPDQYGQGIEGFTVYENSTGSWVEVGSGDYSNSSILFEWNASVAIKLRCYSSLNNTLTGANDTDEGKNYQRHNVTVTLNNGTVVFSQQNFTYVSVATWPYPVWLYSYDVVLNFLPTYAQTYIVNVTYEVFY